MMRLDRWMATLGIGSRSQVQKLIRQGAVKVDNVPVTDPAAPCNPEEGQLWVVGTMIDGRLMRHVLLCKPAGILTAARDKKQPTVMELVPPTYTAIGCMPVGRLDKDTTGLLLLTCDGELNHRLLAPGRHVDKVYRATVDGLLTDKDVAAFAAGLSLGDFVAQPADLSIEHAGNDESTALVTVHEGKFHQVKRMFEAVGRTVLALRRLSFGPLTLDDTLQDGMWRELTDKEVAALYGAAGMER